ncbi:unnamed protein product [Rotaria magnacalcarata]|uniref:Uncharacterized protein n=2 Tax=Rotaria magnacalcarata TaxID=392030 RepID=A0A816S777_9BILA|nr:unnamed protein product [Rotaria magnacalcarata]
MEPRFDHSILWICVKHLNHSVIAALRDINNPPAHLDDKQKSNWIRTAQKAKKNYENQQQYPAFYLPTSVYENYICEQSNHQLALIQIQTIHQQLPCFVVLLELLHLPSYNTLIFVKIKQLFHLIFQSTNKLYSWGPLRQELYPAVNYELLEWPIKSQIFDIQLEFSEWYNWTLSHCEVCSPSLLQDNVINDARSNKNINSFPTCTCHEASP